MHIAIDLDDTLMSTKNVLRGYRMGQPEPGAVAALSRLAQEGHTLTIFTARNVQDPRVRQAILDWCQYFHLPIHNVTNIKDPDFDVMIDNRGLHFTSWSQTLVALHSGNYDAIPHTAQKTGELGGLISDITQPLLDSNRAI